MKKAIFTIAALFALTTNAFAADSVKENVKSDVKEVLSWEVQIEMPRFK